MWQSPNRDRQTFTSKGEPICTLCTREGRQVKGYIIVTVGHTKATISDDLGTRVSYNRHQTIVNIEKYWLNFTFEYLKRSKSTKIAIFHWTHLVPIKCTNYVYEYQIDDITAHARALAPQALQAVLTCMGHVYTN